MTKYWKITDRKYINGELGGFVTKNTKERAEELQRSAAKVGGWDYFPPEPREGYPR